MTACVRVLLLRIHAAHHDSIGELLQALCEGVLPAGTTVETNSSELVQFVCQQVRPMRSASVQFFGAWSLFVGSL